MNGNLPRGSRGVCRVYTLRYTCGRLSTPIVHLISETCANRSTYTYSGLGNCRFLSFLAWKNRKLLFIVRSSLMNTCWLHSRSSFLFWYKQFRRDWLSNRTRISLGLRLIGCNVPILLASISSGRISIFNSVLAVVVEVTLGGIPKSGTFCLVCFD